MLLHTKKENHTQDENVFTAYDQIQATRNRFRRFKRDENTFNASQTKRYLRIQQEATQNHFRGFLEASTLRL